MFAMATPTDSATKAQQRVVVTGSRGLIGTALVAALTAAGHPVTRLVRSAPKQGEALWDPAKGTIDAAAIDGAWAVVHLAGEGIAESKWTPEQKAEILNSRTKSTTLLAQTMAAAANKPSVFASGSAIGIYGDRGEEVLGDDATTGTGFLADVVTQWEACAQPAIDAGIRTAFLRTGIVQSVHGGALKQQLLPFKLALGGRLGSGKQYLPWISLTDEVRAILHVLNSNLSGPVNLVGPAPVTNAVYTKALGKALHRPTLIPIPLFPLKAFYGPELVKEMLLAGARVMPNKLLADGFTFTHTTIKACLSDVLGTNQ
jgi:uncharacterized protein (TIGR01777 family)